ncbi:DUF488 family protein [Terracidiphilus sp.]|jgi:uncharacterized protein (DUF488 family)|uniref:DUF488 domain-containing protein n=1 Tax=Terracidiphilus sp. TaxID=1964191 RepID=UPI003C14D512
MEIYSIGFTQKSAGEFFGILKLHGIERLLDVRLNNTSQLAGFAKQADLAYFLREICGAEYEHEPLLAPTADILDAYKKHKGDWGVYTEAYLSLIRARKVETAIDRESFRKKTVLLCSEATAEHCHRRLALEYLQTHWDDIVIHHL